MALKNLFDMVKADRYTADGREAIIKAQEAETEDATRRTYQIGEISQATGLQKTANGWVKPKSGKQPGAKKEEYKPSRRVDPKKQPQVSNPNVLGMTANGAKKRFEALGGEFLENKDGVDIFKTRDGDLVEVHYGDNKKVLRTQTTPADSVNLTTVRQGPKTKTLNETPAQHVQKNLDAYKGYQPYDMESLVLGPSGYERQTSARTPGGGQSVTYTKNGAEEITLFFDKNGELENADVAGSKPAKKQSATRQRGEELAQPADKRQSAGYQHWQGIMSGYSDGSLLEQRKQLQESVDEFEDDLKDYDRRGLASAAYGKRIDQKNWQIGALKAIDEEMERRGMDPAPRTSVPDSAPSLSEIVDRVYNIGEISEKTGLQKTAQGWKPPKETKFGKVKQNKEGQWGVQTKRGKGSDFLKHKSEKEASRALANYTAGYNTTERSKQDPHSDQARQVKHWDKEVEKIKKENRAEGRAAHAAQFQKPAAESKPQPVSPTAQVEIAEMAMTQAAGLSPAGLAKKYNISEADAKAVRKIMDDMNENARKDRATGEYPGKYSHTKNKPAAEGWEETRMASGKIYDLKSQGKRIIEQYDPETETKKFKLRDLNNSRAPDKEFKSLEEAKNAATKSAEDSALRVLTGDCRIRIRKEKPALTGDTKIRVRK